MKASEALELTHGSFKRKGPLFKARITYLCGKLNCIIEREAEYGETEAKLKDIGQHSAKIYFPLMAELYEENGFFVCYTTRYTYGNEFRVFWDKEKIPSNLKYGYDYYTKENKK